MVTSNGDTFTSTISETMEKPAEMVREYPVSSMLILFGAGIGVGVLIGQTLCQQSSSQSYLDATTSYAERIGRQIYDAVRQAPQAVSRQFQ